jgi:hypothetical protein
VLEDGWEALDEMTDSEIDDLLRVASVPELEMLLARCKAVIADEEFDGD